MDLNNSESVTKSLEQTKIAYVMDLVIVCGGVLVAFEHCQLLREQGIDAFIVGNGPPLGEYDVPVYPMSKLEEFTDDDIIVSVWYPQVTMLEKFKGRKIQLSQDCIEECGVGPQAIEDCRVARRNPNWEIMAVSKYAGDWTGCDYTLIPNGINKRFFDKHDLNRDIDILIEGNNEPNKGIDDAIEIAQSIPNFKIGWLGRETRGGDWELFTNAPREIIPQIYQRSKVTIKCSKSEGFGLPHLEAMASGSLLLTYNSGGNDFCKDGFNCYMGDKEYLKKRLEDVLIGEYGKDIIKNAYNTAELFKWNIKKLMQFYNL